MQVTLKNGTQEALPLVKVTMASLRALIDEKPFAFCELLMKCRNQNHKFRGKNSDVLKEFNLVQDDESIHDSVRNVVLSAVQGTGLDISLGSPIQE